MSEYFGQYYAGPHGGLNAAQLAVSTDKRADIMASFLKRVVENENGGLITVNQIHQADQKSFPHRAKNLYEDVLRLTPDGEAYPITKLAEVAGAVSTCLPVSLGPTLTEELVLEYEPLFQDDLALLREKLGQLWVNPEGVVLKDRNFNINFPTSIIKPWKSNFTCWTEGNVIGLFAEGDSKKAEEHILAVAHWSTKYVFTDGGLLGFFTRYNAQEKLARRLLQTFPPASRLGVGLCGMDYKTRLAAMMPLEPFELDIDMVDELTDLSLMAASPLLKINATSDAGIAWRFSSDELKKVTRKQTYLVDLASGFTIAKACEGKTREEMVPILLRNALNLGKPKMEAIPVDKVYSKIRSIKVANSFNQIQLGMVCTAFAPTMRTIRNSRIVASQGNLYGFTPFKGGMNLFLLDLLFHAKELRKNNTKRFITLYYSDNVFAFDVRHMTWYSLDVAKMESSSTVEEARESMQFILNHVGLGADNDLTREVGDMVNVMGSEVAHNVWCVRNNILFRATGLSTGTPNTFLQNHTRMAAAMAEINFCLEQNPEILFKAARKFVEGSDPTVVFPNGALVPFDLEVTASDRHPTVGLPFLHHESVKQPNFIPLRTASVTPGTLDEFGPIVKLDLLGHDATMVSDLPTGPGFVGCLAWERVWKAILFRRTELQRSLVRGAEVDTAQGFILDCVEFVTVQMLVWVGGFAYEDTHRQLSAVGVFTGINLADRVRKAFDAGQKLYDLKDLRSTVVSRIVGELSALMNEESVDLDESEKQARLSLAEEVYGSLEFLLNPSSSVQEALTILREMFSRRTAILRIHTFRHVPLLERDPERRGRGSYPQDPDQYLDEFLFEHQPQQAQFDAEI